MEAPTVDPNSPEAIGVGNIQDERDSALYQIEHICMNERKVFEACVDRFYAIDKTEAIMKNIHLQRMCAKEFTATKNCMEDWMLKWAVARKGKKDPPPPITSSFVVKKKTVDELDQ